MTDNTNTLWVTGYSAQGFKLSLTLAVNPDTLQSDIVRLLAAIESAGIQARETGVEAGEDKEAVAFVAKRLKDDGTPIVAFYSPNEKVVHKIIHTYLDTDAQQAEFEAATGLTLASIPVTPGNAFLQKNAQGGAQFILRTARPCAVILKPNPKHNPDDAMSPKRVFARVVSEGAPQPTHAVAQPAQQQPAVPSLTTFFGDVPTADTKTFTSKEDYGLWCKAMRKKYEIPEDLNIGAVILNVTAASEHRGGKALAEKQVREWTGAA